MKAAEEVTFLFSSSVNFSQGMKMQFSDQCEQLHVTLCFDM